jgi:hypothetical protein
MRPRRRKKPRILVDFAGKNEIGMLTARMPLE